MSVSKLCFTTSIAIYALSVFAIGSSCHGQGYGIELHNNVMPASGGMAGTSISRPQDNLSAIYGNPATVTQYEGTVFTFGGAFVEPTFNISQSAALPLIGVQAYSAKSDTPASVLPNIGVIHQINLLGRPVTAGMAFVANAGLGVDFRPEPNSNGTLAAYAALDTVNSVGMQLTERLSVGASFTIGYSTLDGPFVDTSSTQSDIAPRYVIGTNFELGGGTSIGGYWQSRKSLSFENVVRFGNGPFQDLALDHPETIGFGIANRCLMNGRLLMAMDVIYKKWEATDFFRALYEDQWGFSFGGQYLVNQRTRFRFGYAYNEDPTRDMVPGTIGGVIPVGGIPSVQYIQGQFAAINQHRLTGGIGVLNFLPGVDLDMSVGGIFENEKTFGTTTSSVESYFLAWGMTWRRGPNAPDDTGCVPIVRGATYEQMPVENLYSH